MQTSDLLGCTLDEDVDSDRHEHTERHDDDGGNIWSSDDQSETNGAPTDVLVSDVTFPVQQFFSEDDVSDDDVSCATIFL